MFRNRGRSEGDIQHRQSGSHFHFLVRLFDSPTSLLYLERDLLCGSHERRYWSRRTGGALSSGALSGLCELLRWGVYRGWAMPWHSAAEQGGWIPAEGTRTLRYVHRVPFLRSCDGQSRRPGHRLQKTPVCFCQSHRAAGDSLRQFVPSPVEERNQDS